MGKLSTLDLGVLVLYLGGLFVMGLYFYRQNDTTEEYFLGGRRFKGWVIGLSLVGTSISSITFLAYPGDAFKTAWLRFLPNLMLPVAIFIAAKYFLPFFRRDKTTTAYEFLEYRFGPSVRIYGALVFIIAQIVRVSLILYLVSLVLQEITGWDAATCIVIGGSVVAAYTIFGGINAVIWTDVIQTIVLLTGGIVCLVVIVNSLPGGIGQILEVAARDGKLAFSELKDGQLIATRWQPDLFSKTASMMLVVGLIGWLTEYSSNQNTIQRFCASRSDHEARKAMLVCVLVSLPTWAFFMFLGTALYVFFQAFPATIAAEILAGEQKAEQILPFFIIHYMPPGLVGLVIAAALAAAMSSLDSSINAISTVSISDIYRRHLNRSANDSHYLLIAQAISVVVGLLMICGAVYLDKTETNTLQDTATILTSLLAGGLLSIYCIGFFTKRGDARHILIGISGTMFFTGWTIMSAQSLLPEKFSFPFDLYYTGFIGNVVMFVLAYCSSFLLISSESSA